MPIILDPPTPITEVPEPGPPLTTSAERINNRLAPLAQADAQSAFLLSEIANALALGSVEIDEVVRDTDTHTAWSMILDPDAAPEWALEWLAQFPGVQLLPSDTEQDRRDRISQAAGFYRGTPRAIRDEVMRTLAGTQRVSVFVHVGGDRWAITCLTRTAETPDPAAAERAALRQKAAGLVLTMATTDNPIWPEPPEGLSWAEIAAGVTWTNVTPADVD